MTLFPSRRVRCDLEVVIDLVDLNSLGLVFEITEVSEMRNSGFLVIGSSVVTTLDALSVPLPDWLCCANAVAFSGFSVNALTIVKRRVGRAVVGFSETTTKRILKIRIRCNKIDPKRLRPARSLT